MEQSIELMVGIVFFVLGLSYMLRADDWTVALDHIQKKGRRASLTIGSILIFWGSFLLAFHWVWQGLPILATIIGLILTVKGTVYLLFPSWLSAKITILERHNLNSAFRISGFLTIIVALVILYGWWKVAYPSPLAYEKGPHYQTTGEGKLAQSLKIQLR